VSDSGNVFARRLRPALPTAVGSQGAWIEDADGRRYLDASGGAIVVNLGHGRETVAKAVYDQILAADYIHPTMFTTEPVERLAAALTAHAPEGIDRFYFLSGGSEAVEAAIKMARQIHLERGRPQRFRLVSRWKSYHGLTLGALSAMGRTAFRQPYAPMLHDAVHVPAPYCLRCSFGLHFPDCDLRCARFIEETFQNLGPETISAFLAETVSGGTLAAVPPPPGYWPLVRKICDTNGVLLIHDEVMCGMGRTGKWFGCQNYAVEPDLLTLGKGLAGGVLALSAVGVRSEHFRSIAEGSGYFVHGGTFSHHPVAAAAGLAAVRILESEGLVERVARLDPVLADTLRSGLADHPNVADIRGVGFLWGVELVRDRDTLVPFPRARQVTERVWDAAFRRGVIVYKSTGLAGADGDAFLVAPPFIIEEKDMVWAVAQIREALEDVLGSGR
jgi:adenosylmethionine-8-amino-7-oxononanoate aminotransferase